MDAEGIQSEDFLSIMFRYFWQSQLQRVGRRDQNVPSFTKLS